MELNNAKYLDWAYQLNLIAQTIAHKKASEVQQELLDHIVSFFGADSGCIALFDYDRKALSIVAGSGSAANYIDTKIALGDGILGWVAKEKQPLLLSGEVSSDPRFKNLQPRNKVNRPGSALCWPLLSEDEIFGAFSINRSRDNAAFVESDLNQGGTMVNFISPVVWNVKLYKEQQQRNEELQAINAKLQEAQDQLLQSEKMASIGQLAAGVAHEINNPVGYISSNLWTLQRYVGDLVNIIEIYEKHQPLIHDAAALKEIHKLKQELNLEFIKEDIVGLVDDCREGTARVKQIVKDLRNFSHKGEAEWQWSDLHRSLDSALNIVHNEIKYKAEVIKRYGNLPEIECIAPQLNQVFLNLLVNAAQAIEDTGAITITTGTVDNDWVWVDIRDTGKGIKNENLEHIFEPFFTTKPVGEGTGLGLSLSYGIIKKHKGRIQVKSTEGNGTTFRIWLPVKQQLLQKTG